MKFYKVMAGPTILYDFKTSVGLLSKKDSTHIQVAEINFLRYEFLVYKMIEFERM